MTIITELSTAVFLYCTRIQTMTIAICTYVERGNDGIAAAKCAGGRSGHGDHRSAVTRPHLISKRFVSYGRSRREQA